MNKKKKTLKGGLGRISKAALAIAVLAFLALVGVNGAIPKEAKAYTISDNYPKVEIMSSINNETIFSDVANHWAIDPIRWASENNLVGGYEDGTFRPDNQVTEAEFAAILARYATNVTVEGEPEEGEHWAQAVYDTLEKYGMPLRGYNNDKIKNQPITRGQIARIVAAKNGFNLDEVLAIEYMYENDLSGGFDSTKRNYETYGADQYLTRAQAVAFMQRLSKAGITTFRGEESPISDGRELGSISGEPLTVEDVGEPDWSKFTPEGYEVPKEPQVPKQSGRKYDDFYPVDYSEAPRGRYADKEPITETYYYPPVRKETMEDPYQNVEFRGFSNGDVTVVIETNAYSRSYNRYAQIEDYILFRFDQETLDQILNYFRSKKTADNILDDLYIEKEDATIIASAFVNGMEIVKIIDLKR